MHLENFGFFWEMTKKWLLEFFPGKCLKKCVKKFVVGREQRHNLSSGPWVGKG